MTIKDEKKELEALLRTSAPAAQGPGGQQVQYGPDVDPMEELEPEPLFEIDYDKIQKQLARKARESVKRIVRSVIRNQEYADSEFVQDKISQDAEQLGNLYMEQYQINQVKRSLIDTIGKGNNAPRMYEVFTQVSKTYSDISKQISDFQISMKDNYAKIKFDMMGEDVPKVNALGTAQVPQLEDGQEKDRHIFIGTKGLADMLKQDKVRALETAEYKEA